MSKRTPSIAIIVEAYGEWGGGIMGSVSRIKQANIAIDHDIAQAVAIEREAIAAYLSIEARSYAHHVGDALTAEEASGSFSALMIAAQAIRNGEHVKP